LCAAVRGCGGLLRVACGAIEADAERLTAASRSDVGGFSPRAASGAGPGAEDRRAERRRLAAVWLAAGSAVAAAVGSGWVLVLRNGGRPPGGDMVGHAAAAEWLRTLPWWDWRGWSDWFYGGQAIGVNYPPLGHAWMRFTDPVHGQMAAVAIGLLVVLPWGALRLARAVGYSSRAQRASVAAVLVLAALSGHQPPLAAQLGGVHRRVGHVREVPAASPAPIRLGTARPNNAHTSRLAVRADNPLGPAVLDEPRLRLSICGEPAEEPREAHPGLDNLVRLAHAPIVALGCDTESAP